MAVLVLQLVVMPIFPALFCLAALPGPDALLIPDSGSGEVQGQGQRGSSGGVQAVQYDTLSALQTDQSTLHYIQTSFRSIIIYSLFDVKDTIMRLQYIMVID